MPWQSSMASQCTAFCVTLDEGYWDAETALSGRCIHRTNTPDRPLSGKNQSDEKEACLRFVPVASGDG